MLKKAVAGYSPPEQYQRRAREGPWTDIYAVAATMYRSISGKASLEAIDRMAADELFPPSQMGTVIGDEPDFVNVVLGRDEDCGREVVAEIRELCEKQPFAVLATQGEGQPYTSLISFAVSEDLQHLVLSTPSQTRKYALIVKNKKVSLMIDNRADQPESINLVRAVTVTGRARPLEEPREVETWAKLLLAKHSYLEKFVQAPSSSLILIDITRYFYVRRFQEVYQWIPGRDL